MKPIRYNLTKACRIFVFFTESLYKNMGILPLNFKKFRLFIEELYTRLYHRYMFEAVSYYRDPHSTGYSSISILYFSFVLVPGLRGHIVL